MRRPHCCWVAHGSPADRPPPMWFLDEVIRAVAIESPTRYSWFGSPSVSLPKRVRDSLSAAEAREYLLYLLTSRLYSDFYLPGRPVLRNLEPGIALRRDDTPFVTALSAANCGDGPWEPGWRVRRVTDDAIHVSRGDLTIQVSPERCLQAGATLTPESIVQVRVPKELLGMSPGFYMALGNNPLPTPSGEVLVRVYWNLSAGGAIPFVRIASRLLNSAALPFRLKVLNDRALFGRCDAGVIYLQKRDYPRVVAVLDTLQRNIAEYLRTEIPALTKEIAPGVAIAESPGGESFGQHRCRLLAHAIVRAHEEGKTGLQERIDHVATHFDAQGLTLARPFLNPASADDYEPLSGVCPRGAAIPNDQGESDLSPFLDTAYELGWKIAKEAIWHRDQCNWIGSEPLNLSGNGLRPTCKPLGPTLYAGTAGIALFLAELCIRSGCAETRATAVAAVRHAISHSPPDSPGLYTGALGIMLAAARAGMILDEQELVDSAALSIKQWDKEGTTPAEFDLLSGCAGTVVACLLLREALQDESLLDVAARHGDELLKRAERSTAGHSWSSVSYRYKRNLTGMSHGTAGAAYALLELFRVSGEPKYRVCAEQALEYERHWFDAEKGNWPDFRQWGKRKRGEPRVHFVSFWCHGAAGIALARLRACELTRDKLAEEEAIIALNTTHATLQTALRGRSGNFSLCHGLAGNAEALLYGREVLGAQWAQKALLAYEIARYGIQLSKEAGDSWHCGIDQGATPALMLGLAGIGYFYLRLCDPAVPSILIPRREQFSGQDSTISRRASVKCEFGGK